MNTLIKEIAETFAKIKEAGHSDALGYSQTPLFGLERQERPHSPQAGNGGTDPRGRGDAD
jgi:hypothetical protein